MRAENVHVFVGLRGPLRRPRAAQAPPVRVTSISLITDIQRRVAAGETLPAARAGAAADFIRSPRYVPATPRWALLVAAEGALADALRRADGAGSVDRVRRLARDTLRQILGDDGTLEELIAGEAFATLREDLAASLLSSVVADAEPELGRLLEFFVRLLAVMEVAADDEALAAALRDFPARRLMLPAAAVVAPEREEPATPEGGEAGVEPARRARIDELERELDAVRSAATEVRTVIRRRIEPTDGPPAPDGDGGTDVEGRAGVDPSRHGAAELSARTRETLNRHGVAHEGAETVLRVARDLDVRLATIAADLDELSRVERIAMRRGVAIRVTDRLVLDRTAPGDGGPPPGPASFTVGGRRQESRGAGTPVVRPAGVGDLLVLKQRLLRYEPAKLAHIETVMASETRGREHRRLRQTETVITMETEREEETSRDLFSAERFELQAEVGKTVRKETQWEAGAELSASFGPVGFSAYGRFSTSESTEETQRSSTRYAKEVTQRSLSRIVERVREQRTVRTLEEVEERNEHRFLNADGPNRSGVYRYVDTVWRAKVVNWGKRLFYEFVVPEPAAFLRFAAESYQDANMPTEPEPPRSLDEHLKPVPKSRLGPAGVTRETYLALAKRYGAEGIAPPPPEYVTLARTVARELSPDRPVAIEDSELTVPDGYVVVGWTFSARAQPGSAAFFVGPHPLTTDTITPITGKLPLGIIGTGLDRMLMAVSISCELTAEAYAAWQLRTFDAIMAAYERRRATFEEELAAAQSYGVRIVGRNPDVNRAREREELKKACITLWTGHRYDATPMVRHDAGAPPPGDRPELRLDSAARSVARSIQFVEEAFDWPNLTYTLLPYFWARRSQWLPMQAAEDPDPFFEAFQRAGAALVRVPVNLTATEAVLFYQLTGRLWPGEKVPAVAELPTGVPSADGATDIAANATGEEELYNAYLNELAPYIAGVADGEDLDAGLHADVPIAADDPDAFEYVVPTNLVWLQPDDTLPDFEA